MVEFAPPFFTSLGGDRATDFPNPGGVRTTFFATKNRTQRLPQAEHRQLLPYAKVVLFKVLLRQARATARLFEKESSTKAPTGPTERSAAIDFYSGEKLPRHSDSIVGRGKKTRGLTTFHNHRRLILGGSSADTGFDPPSDRRAIAAGGDPKHHARRSEIDPLHGLGKPKRGATLRGANVTAYAATAGVSTHWRDRRGSTPAVATAYRRPATFARTTQASPDRPRSGQHPGEKPGIFFDTRHPPLDRVPVCVRAGRHDETRARRIGCPGRRRRVILQALTPVMDQQR